MNLNGTLIVQMLNFAIAYVMIRYFLLKPLVPLLLQDRRKVSNLLYAISQQEDSLTVLDAKKQDQWLKLQWYVHKNIPKTIVHKGSHNVHSAEIKPVFIDQPHIIITNEMAEQIVHSAINTDLRKES